jgi:TctA family transporter
MATLSWSGFTSLMIFVVVTYVRYMHPKTAFDVAPILVGLLVGHATETLRNAWRADHPRR